jgi:hypothetical protein
MNPKLDPELELELKPKGHSFPQLSSNEPQKIEFGRSLRNNQHIAGPIETRSKQAISGGVARQG